MRSGGGVPQEILYDRMKTVWQEVDDRGEVAWNPGFLDSRATRSGNPGKSRKRVSVEATSSVGRKETMT
ncbi:hypothetical protein SBV1_980002 [Verrucomicrobia bacterium]|nr:hypothetical protein SBV1_980002 [Verrucomicrobiota bacterium]